LYEIRLKNQTLGAFGKIGYIFPSKKYKSIGLMQSFSSNETNQNFGNVNQYSGNQNTYYANLIYQSIIGSTNLKFRMGTSFRWDKYKEEIAMPMDSTISINPGNPSRTEIVPGAFGAFTWNPIVRLTAVGGLRIDHHNLFGFWLTPRMHIKYDVSENSSIRFSAGNGRRLANIFAENSSLMATSRVFRYPGEFYHKKEKGLLPEMAWNYGLSWSHGFELLNRKGNFSLDGYRTDFQNQIVVDLDSDPAKVNFYNLNGKSFSNAIQVQIEYEIVKRFDIRMAYKWLDVRQTVGGNLLEKPFVASHRFFVNLAYKTRSKWTVDATFNWNGSKRIPNTRTNPEEFRFPERSPTFWVLNAQIAKAFGKNLEFYVGAENMFDFRQIRLINNPENPFGNLFDASMVWGPVIGRMVYGGLRFTIK
jgi:outer membrane receptor for ferrienterochelin and colicin